MIDQHFAVLPKWKAKELGRKTFYGSRCKKHGFSPRYVSDKSCYLCRNRVESIEDRAEVLRNKERDFLQSNSEEVWKPINIPAYEEDYKVSNMGRVWSNLRCVPSGRGGYRFVGGHLMTPTDDGDGYNAVGLTSKDSRKTMRIHRLVMLTFNGYPPEDRDDYQINHKDGIKTNNFPFNLEWVTPQDNTTHAVVNGLWDGRNEKATNVKLKWEEVDYIRKHYKYKCPVNNAVRLAEKFDIESTTVYNIVSGYTWNEEYRNV